MTAECWRWRPRWNRLASSTSCFGSSACLQSSPNVLCKTAYSLESPQDRLGGTHVEGAGHSDKPTAVVMADIKVVCPYGCLFVCFGHISSDTAERIWLKLCTRWRSVPDTCVSHFGGDRPGDPAWGPSHLPKNVLWGDTVSALHWSVCLALHLFITSLLYIWFDVMWVNWCAISIVFCLGLYTVRHNYWTPSFKQHNIVMVYLHENFRQIAGGMLIQQIWK